MEKPRYSAKMTLATREDARRLCEAWGRHSLHGHSMGAGTVNVDVELYGVRYEDMSWIESFVSPSPSENAIVNASAHAMPEEPLLEGKTPLAP